MTTTHPHDLDQHDLDELDPTDRHAIDPWGPAIPLPELTPAIPLPELTPARALVELADRLDVIAYLLQPCPAPDLAAGWDLCAHAQPWPCPTTHAAWLAWGLHPEIEAAAAHGTAAPEHAYDDLERSDQLDTLLALVRRAQLEQTR